ncbi:DUF1178 family protein [Jannaschia pohangensis]|uniref:DUF1178 family protein n=1 Tax=Jannaschia pohangensis TaxID=390807 RepID=A0A1I3SIX0_9RHOB|nr:DUF1178 family protein [Jannaschia pohangensis]SFJ58668.1 hypothetical protein SAMN04488095_3172 [Jannaschia pohangensis]
MIRYSLKCSEGHAFDSWFQSVDAYDRLVLAGMATCAVCGSKDVEKALMAPKVGGSLSAPASDMEARVASLRAKVEAEATYVGSRFASEARAIHESGAPDRPIYGEANGAEVKALLEDGIPVAPLPFIPKSRAN